jgi:short-subunit dehydrogenase
MNTLVVGGTSGLGLALAKLLKAINKEGEVLITGRTDPLVPGLDFYGLPLSWELGFSSTMDWLIENSDPFDMVIYNPGFYQEGRITDLSDKQIKEMVNVGFLAAAMLMQRILKNQGELDTFVAITSTSQWTPREHEPVYTGVKAALGMLANSLSLDERIKKTLVAAPSGMKTKFWKGTNKDTRTFLEPALVARHIVDALSHDFSYRYMRILRDPYRLEVVEER